MRVKIFPTIFTLVLSAFPVFASTAEQSGVASEPDITAKMTNLVIQVGIILFAARIGGMLAEKVNLPSVLGELGAGIVIGPYALGCVTLWGLLPQGIFPIEAGAAAFPVSPELYGLCTVASIVLLFLAGVETDMKMFMRYSLAGSLVGLGGVVFSFLAGDLAACMFLHRIFPSLYSEPVGFMDAPAMFLGIMCTATSVGITARILSERKCIDSEEGITIMAGAVIDDVLGIIVLAIGLGVIGASGGESGDASVQWGEIGIIAAKAFGVWLGATAIGILAARRISGLLKLFHDELPIATMALGLALILAGFFQSTGLAMIIGAYVMGLSLSRTDIRYVINENLHAIYTFMVPIFFCVMGMMVDVGKLMDWHVIAFGLAYTLTAVLAKLLGCSIPALFCGFNLRGALRIGAGMIPRGEVALIIAGIGLSEGYLTPEIFGIGILMTLLTTVVAPPLLVEMFKSPESGLRRPKTASASPSPFSIDLPSSAAAEMLCSKLMEAFRREGFFTHILSHENHIWQVRRDNVEIGVRRVMNKVEFECSKSEKSLVATAVLEVVAELTALSNALSKPITTGTMEHAFAAQDDAPVSGSDADLRKYISGFMMRPTFEAKNKNEAFASLCRLLYEHGLVSDYEKCLNAIKERENIMSTGLEHGVAFPHAKTNSVKSLVGIVAIVHNGIPDYTTTDGSIVKIIVMTLSSEDEHSPHLRVISHMSRILNEQGREKMLSVKTESSMRDILMG